MSELKKHKLSNPVLRCLGILLLFLFFAHSAYAQITFKAERMPLKEVLSKIERVSKYKFFYNEDLEVLKKNVSIDVKNVSIERVMNILLKDSNVGFKKQGDELITLVPHISSTAAPGSKKTVHLTGVVKDASGEPIIGANIVVRGTTTGTITDLDGKFTLDTPSDAQLVVTYIGYLEQTIPVGGRNTLSVVMKEDTKTLDEVVVVGYGSQKKVNLTGAVSSVKMDEVMGNRPVTTVSNALMGTMPGLQITASSGAPGSALNFNVRGVNSINGGSPLVLVDNVEMDINMLDPNDIESVSVLKDAASSAIYGARAAFGVILVTTKKEAENAHFSVNYSNNFSFSNPINLPKKATPLQTVQAYKDMGFVAYTSSQDVDTWLDLLKKYEANPSAYPNGYTEVDGLRYNLVANDLFKDMMETGFQQSHNVSFGGGAKNLAFRISAGTVSQNGVLVTDKDMFKRTNLSAYIKSTPYQWISPELDVKYARSNSSLPYTTASYGIWGGAVAFPSYFPIGNMELNEVTYPFNTPRTFIELADTKGSRKDDLRIFGKVTLTPIKDLKIVGEYTFNMLNTNNRTFDKKFTYMHGLQFRPETSVGNSELELEELNSDYHALNVYATYARVFGKHDLTVMAGFNQERYDIRGMNLIRYNMINENLPAISQATGDYNGGDTYKEYGSRGVFYRLNYNYQGKYLFETNGRYDGSSKFPKKNRFGFFPSFSLGWRASEEQFMEWSRSVVSNLKLRASYGSIGNQSIEPYAFVPGMPGEKAYWILDGQRATTLGMPMLVSNSFTWEKVNTLDFGIDLGLFNNRLSLVFDWYKRDTKGMLAPGMELPGVLGADAPLQNTADLQSKGWELSLDWNDRIGKVDYYVGFNLYDSRTHITKYNNEVGLLGTDTYREGMELGEIWGYTSNGFYTADDFENGKLKAGIPKVEGFNPNPGDMKYVDYNGDGIINAGQRTAKEPGDMQIIGNNTRRYQYGIKAGASYKGFSISMMMQGVGKRDLWMMNELYYPHYDKWSTLYSTQLDYWTAERTNAFFPRLYVDAQGNTPANTLTQTKFLQNGAYLELRNVTLAYSLPNSLISKWGLRKLSVFFSGENLANFNHLPKGMDPERESVSRGFAYPYMRQLSFGLNLNF